MRNHNSIYRNTRKIYARAALTLYTQHYIKTELFLSSKSHARKTAAAATTVNREDEIE